MKRLAILGLGHIGSYVLERLADSGRNVGGYDLSNGHDLSDIAVLQKIMSSVDGVLVCTPFHLNKTIAEQCALHGVDYFDLTESVEVTDYIKSLDSASRFVTQCGLAPGMVSIIAADLAVKFDTVNDIQIRVGALSTNANNHLQYYRSWNTEGLINEYIHPCPALVDGELVALRPLQDQELVTIAGMQLEAANTSGGIGSLAESYAGRARNVNYKTLRYPGHWNHIRFLADDLGLKQNFQTYVDLFNRHVPQCDNDRVYIHISVNGYNNGRYNQQQYTKIIECSKLHTAIQIATGCGVLCVLDAWMSGALDDRNGWIAQESLPFDAVFGSRWFKPYTKI